MSDVAGINAVQQAIDVLLENNWRGDLRDQLEDVKALLRNRQELYAALDAIITSVGYGQGVNGAEWKAAKAALECHKELDND